MPREEWECTIKLPSGERQILAVTISPPFGIRQADAEVQALRQAAGIERGTTLPDGFSCLHSRFLREVAS